MKKTILLLLLVYVNGCAVLKTGDGMHRELAQATALLDAGDRAGAAVAFAAISDSRGVPGVTDEALFRLALLSLRPAAEKEGNPQALQLLKRLKKEYPASRWTAQSVQLADMLAGVEELRRQIRSLKNQNQSLGKEVNELNRNIQQLKQLDQELEKARH
jgi:peptidoglycan hydrolase CwlO-like protein